MSILEYKQYDRINNAARVWGSMHIIIVKFYKNVKVQNLKKKVIE